MTPTTDIEKIDETLSEDSLIEVIRAKRDMSAVLSALKLHARFSPKRRREVFGMVLEDPEHSSRAKRLAARQLGTEPEAENQAFLIRELNIKEPTVLASVAQSLGRIGDEEALVELEKIQMPSDRRAAASVAFAKTLLSYRHRLDRNLITPPGETELVEVTEAETFQIEQPDSDTVTTAIQEVQAELPAVPLTVDGAAKLTCRSTELLLVFSEAFRTTRSTRTIRTRSALPMVLLKKGLSLERFGLAQYFFTQPSETPDSVEILGTRPSGALTYAGKVKVSDAGFDFTLKSVDTKYAPAIDLEGRYNPRTRSFEFSRALSSTQVAASQEKRAVTPSKVAFKPT